LKSIINSADTILLVGHKQTDGFIIKDDETGKISQPLKVVEHGRPNSDVITNLIVLPDSVKNRLLQLIIRKNTDKIIETCNCFIPLYSALFIKNGCTSYIDICFGCNTFIISVGKKRSFPIYLGKENMRDLKLFFNEMGIPTE
jgi:hypothetical protein